MKKVDAKTWVIIPDPMIIKSKELKGIDKGLFGSGVFAATDQKRMTKEDLLNLCTAMDR
jgi:hypothetical protein